MNTIFVKIDFVGFLLMKPTYIACTNTYVHNFQTYGFHLTFKINYIRVKQTGDISFKDYSF